MEIGIIEEKGTTNDSNKASKKLQGLDKGLAFSATNPAATPFETIINPK